jgi:hypothetical protein
VLGGDGTAAVQHLEAGQERRVQPVDRPCEPGNVILQRFVGQRADVDEKGLVDRRFQTAHTRKSIREIRQFPLP